MFPPFSFLSFILAQSRDFGSVLSDFLMYLVSGCRQKVSRNKAIYSLLPAFRWISPDEVAASSKVKQFCLTWLFQVMENNSVWFKEKEFIRRIKGRRWEEARKRAQAGSCLWIALVRVLPLLLTVYYHSQFTICYWEWSCYHSPSLLLTTHHEVSPLRHPLKVGTLGRRAPRVRQGTRTCCWCWGTRRRAHRLPVR